MTGQRPPALPSSRAPTAIEKLRAIGGSKSFQHRNHVPPGQLYACAPTIECFTQNARRCEIVHTRLTRSAAERGRTARRHAGNTVDHCDQSRRSTQPQCPAARGCSSPAQHTASKGKPTGLHPWLEKNSFRTQPAPRAAGGEESLAGASTPGRNSGDTGGLVRLGQRPGACATKESAAHDRRNAKACRSNPATTVEGKVHSPDRPAHPTAFLVEESSA